METVTHTLRIKSISTAAEEENPALMKWSIFLPKTKTVSLKGLTHPAHCEAQQVEFGQLVSFL